MILFLLPIKKVLDLEKTLEILRSGPLFASPFVPPVMFEEAVVVMSPGTGVVRVDSKATFPTM